jgi:putative membrane protein
MRWIIREWVLYILSLFILDSLFSWIRISGPQTLVATATTLLILNTVGKPILKILWLPINIITLGLFSWVLSIIVVVLVVLFVPGFHIDMFTSSAFDIGRFHFPAIHLKFFWTYFLFSFLLAWAVGFLRWLLIEGD